MTTTQFMEIVPTLETLFCLIKRRLVGKITINMFGNGTEHIF